MDLEAKLAEKCAEFDLYDDLVKSYKELEAKLSEKCACELIDELERTLDDAVSGSIGQVGPNAKSWMTKSLSKIKAWREVK